MPPYRLIHVSGMAQYVSGMVQYVSGMVQYG